jgi:succinate dehydrogenase/fumarate reductase flavoprotein subunit
MPETRNNLLIPNNLFDLENEVMKDLTDFNKKYRLYLTCGQTGNVNQKDVNQKICSEVKGGTFYTDVTNAYAKLTNPTRTATAPLGSLVALQNAINKLQLTTGGIDQAQYMKNYTDILNKYQDVVRKRQSLDSSLAELYEIGDSSSNFYQKKLVSTSYTKILLTVLATSLTVAAFMTMRNK